MYPRRDAYGVTHQFKAFRAHEPNPQSVEAIHKIDRNANKRLTASTPLTDTAPNYAASCKVISKENDNGAVTIPRRKRQLPKIPTVNDLHERIQNHQVYYYDKEAPPESTTTCHSSYVHPNVSGLILPEYFLDFERSDPIARSGNTSGKWQSNHGFSEREPIGSMPLFMVGEDAEQIAAWHDAELLMTSLRVSDSVASNQWWNPARSRPQSAPSSGTDSRLLDTSAKEESSEMPEVFTRLTDHKHYNGTHKHRFSQDGAGMGLEGRREDDTYRQVLAGKAQITRDIDLEMDAPNKPKMPWETAPSKTRSRSVSASSSSSRRKISAKEQVFERLYKPSRRVCQLDGDYETRLKIMNDFGVNKDLVAKWQVA
eukprot:gene9063-1378_t